MSDTAPPKAIKFVRSVFPYAPGETAWFAEKHAAAYVKSGAAAWAPDAVYTAPPPRHVTGGRKVGKAGEIEPPPDEAA